MKNNNRIILGILFGIAISGCFGFIRYSNIGSKQTEIVTSIEIIGGHEYVRTIVTGYNGYGVSPAVTMVHHAGCRGCKGENLE